jgi:chromosome partitioning protein
MSLLPSSPELAGAEVELINLDGRESRLRTVLEPIKTRYDYILVDCPPSLGLLTLNGLAAATEGVLIPVQCEYLALEGLGQLTQTINRVKQSIFQDLTIRGVILTMYDGRTNLAADVVHEVQRYFGKKVFNAVIPRSIRLAEAPSYGMPISVFAPDSSGARAYAALAKELLVSDDVNIPIVQESK